MINYLPFCFILAILGTLLVNPMFYFQFFKKRKLYLEELRDFKKKEKEGEKPYPVSKYHYRIFDSNPTMLIIGQVILFILVFLFSYLIFLNGKASIRWSTFLVCLWMPAIAQAINFIVIGLSDDTSFIFSIKGCITVGYGIMALVFFLISVGICTHTGVYNYLYPYEDITIMEENYQEYPPSNKITALFKEATLAAGSTLKEPIYRNGKWIYPVVNTDTSAYSSGYFEITSSGEGFGFSPVDLVYTPWGSSTNKVEYVIRRKFPSAVFFGDATFQIEPESREVYFCQFYGDYACLRAGRDVEGIILVNATTGECIRYFMDEIPSWISGISF